MIWVDPITINKLLDNFSNPLPPEEKSVYIISIKSWRERPTEECLPIYVGSTTGHSQRFRTRIGDLVADMFGLYCAETGHHSGGIKINHYCKENNINPKRLYIGWLKRSNCERCDENRIYDQFSHLLLNRSRPPRCNLH